MKQGWYSLLRFPSSDIWGAGGVDTFDVCLSTLTEFDISLSFCSVTDFQLNSSWNISCQEWTLKWDFIKPLLENIKRKQCMRSINLLLAYHLKHYQIIQLWLWICSSRRIRGHISFIFLLLLWYQLLHISASCSRIRTNLRLVVRNIYDLSYLLLFICYLSISVVSSLILQKGSGNEPSPCFDLSGGAK